MKAHGHRHAVHGLRLRGQAGARQHPQRRPRRAPSSPSTRAPRPGAVYNLGGGRGANCSMLEAIDACERIAGRELDWTLSDEARIGDHRWWISDLERLPRRLPRLGHHGRRRRTAAGDPRRQRSSAGAPPGREALGRDPRPQRGGVDRRDRARRPPLRSRPPSIDYEVIVVDDASSDGTAAVVEALAGRQPGDPLAPLALRARLRVRGPRRARPVRGRRGRDHDGRRLRRPGGPRRLPPPARGRLRLRLRLPLHARRRRSSTTRGSSSSSTGSRTGSSACCSATATTTRPTRSRPTGARSSRPSSRCSPTTSTSPSSCR